MSIFLNWNEKFLNQPVERKALKKVKKTFIKDLARLEKNFNKKCFYKNFQQVKQALTSMFYKNLETIETNQDLINLFKFKYESSKIDKAIIFNISNYLLCYNMLDNTCNLCKNCYASQQEMVTSNQDPNIFPSIDKWIKNYIIFTYLWFIRNPNQVLYNIALKLSAFYHSRLKKPLFIRVNEKSDIRNQQDLKNISTLASMIYKLTGLNTYTYTKTKHLKWDNVTPHLRVNKSGGLYEWEPVHEQGKYYTSDSLEKTIYLLSRGLIPCTGSCLECGFKCGNLKTVSRVTSIHGSKKLDLKGALYE